MNVFEAFRKFEKLNDSKIREFGIEATLDNEDVILDDSIEANLEGFTFAGNEIDAAPPFSDWHETGEFHEGLSFLGNTNIEFASKGDGFSAIKEAFTEKDYAAPTAKTLKIETLKKITLSFIEKVKTL